MLELYYHQNLGIVGWLGRRGISQEHVGLFGDVGSFAKRSNEL